MVNLSFFEEVADKASLILPTVYLPIVEECTAPHLDAPTREHVNFLQEKIRSVPEDIGELLRALRRRLHDEDARIRTLTLKLMDLLVRSGTPAFHNELAGNKGLLREIEQTATSTSHTRPWDAARREARTLISNFNSWFQRNPNPNTHIFTTLVTDVKQTSGPSSFVGIVPDLTVQLQLPGDSARRPRRSTPHSKVSNPAQRKAPAPLAGGSRHQQGRGTIVDAIAVDLPTESSISAMLDACATLAEYLGNAEVDPATGAFNKEDDILISFCKKIQEDHSYLALLLSSDLGVDRDVIRSLLDSQAAILHQVKNGRPISAGGSSAGNSALEAAKKSGNLGSRSAEGSPSGPSGPIMETVHQDPMAIPTSAIYRPRTAATADVEESTPPSSEAILQAAAAPAPSAPAPLLEDLFSAPSATEQPVVETAAPVDLSAPTTGPGDDAKDPSAPAVDAPSLNVEDDFDDFLDKELGGTSP